MSPLKFEECGIASPVWSWLVMIATMKLSQGDAKVASQLHVLRSAGTISVITILHLIITTLNYTRRQSIKFLWKRGKISKFREITRNNSGKKKGVTLRISWHWGDKLSKEGCIKVSLKSWQIIINEHRIHTEKVWYNNKKYIENNFKYQNWWH